MRRFFFLTGFSLVVLAAVLAYIALSGDDAKQDDQLLAIGTPLPPVATEVPAEPQGDPRLAALAITRLVVPKIGVDAPVQVLGIKPDGTMQSPSGPTQVGWYTFSAKPGQPSNLVMSGHLDYINYGAAVFYHLRDLRPGDQIKVDLEDGTELAYQVETVSEYIESEAPVEEIVGPTKAESITLITCSGSFDPSSRLYNRRLVVRGSRLPV